MANGFTLGPAFRAEQLPIAMLTTIIRMFGNAVPEGTPAVVVDPFGGTHSTGVAAMMCGCDYIGMDIDKAARLVGVFHMKHLINRPDCGPQSSLLGTDNYIFLYLCSFSN